MDFRESDKNVQETSDGATSTEQNKWGQGKGTVVDNMTPSIRLYRVFKI